MEKKLVHLPVYEGPLDLLLGLIAKNEVDIYDIPIAKITSEYMQYLYEMNELNIELASEFIVMAAQLIEIKSKMLLPAEEEEELDATDPREELVRRLIEYRIFKQVSEYIKSREDAYGKIVTRDPAYYPQLKDDYSSLSITASMLASAMRAILVRHKIRMEEMPSDYTIETESISVQDKLIELAQRLERESSFSFFSIFSRRASKAQIVATFLAVLELFKRNLVILSQEGNYEDILIEKTPQTQAG